MDERKEVIMKFYQHDKDFIMSDEIREHLVDLFHSFPMKQKDIISLVLIEYKMLIAFEKKRSE